ncbi:hypothetical protein Poli38472_006856 [Pythium oligandrum]|uniref:Uncharacterized protein n=1 Tax=Pythium oligandrum TaxID=41045 RepID=A0A8K1C5J5_PYTOL|nr:hypothetical protein Poli38472_006856 [Pythium oligandrum]|eukprot:TMW56846.1 hypothetical protein Poli38472_006856 [Pythium oligandrum]
MLLQVEDNLFGGGAASSQVPASRGLQVESIKAISSNKNESEVDSTALNLKSVLAILRRYIAIHFAVQPAIVKGSSAVPIFPALSEAFDLLYTESYRVAEPVLELSGATIPIAEHNRPSIGASGALRRSFEIIIAPRRFSPLTKSLEFRYSDMIAPSECSGRLAMSPLLKPNEFSITTWLFVREGYTKTPEDPPLPRSPQLDDRQLIFLRGNAREIFPYMMLTRDMEAQWQIEVGIVMNLRDDALPNSPPRLMWERLVTKDPIPLRRWIHVAVVLEGLKMRLYINGILDSQRTISASHAACCANGSIDLDFRFGRISSTPIDQHDGRVSGATSAYHFFAALLAANSSKAVGAVLTTAASSLRSFDGLLSHFRFHNRSLSPIHVRIVFDEKKPPKDDANRAGIITNPASTVQPTAEVQAVLKLHAVLLVLSDSGEGQVHLSQPKWIAHLWDTFVRSNNLLVQRSSLQLLRRVLRHQTPVTLSAVLFKHTGAEQGDSLFIGLVFRIVGCCLSIYRKTPIEAASASKEKTDDQTLPVAIDRGILCAKDQLESGPPFELRNSVAEEIANDNCRRLHILSIANDLVHMLTRLFRDASDKWAQPILTTILRVLERLSVPSVGEKNFHAIEAIGCLYLLGGAMESLRSGADVTITGTDELGTVVVMDETSVDRIPAGNGQPSRSEVCVSLHRPHLVTEQTGDSPSSWYDQVLKYCSRVTKNCEENSDTKFIRLHSDDVQLHSTPSLMSKELLSLDNGDAIVSGIVTSVLQMGIETSFGIEGGACGLSVLRWWHTSGLLIKALKQLVRTERGAAALVRTPDVLVKLVQSAARDDGNPTFGTLQELEEKLCIVRSRLYQVLADLGDDATPELEQWLAMKRKHRSSNEPSKGDGDKSLEDSPETSFDLDEGDNDQRLSALETPESDSGRCVRNPDETSDLQQEREKSRGDESKDDNVEDDDGECEEEVDDEEDGEDEDEDEDDDDGEDNDEEDTDAEEHRQEFVDELMMMGFPEEWCVLALKQTENDIVSASAWIVDNLEYLSRLQTTLDKQREQSSVNLAFNDDDDDNTEELMAAGDGLQSEVAPSSSPHNLRASEIKTASVDANSAGVSENTSSPLVNDKETGRKVFGEMYFPFEEGGYESNTRYRFFTCWREETIAADASTTLEEKAPAAEVNAECAIDRFARDVEEMELVALLDQIRILEHAYRVVCTRQVLVTLWSHKNVENRATLRGLSDIPEILTLTKLLIVRGDQFPDSRLHDEYPGIKSSSFKPEQIMFNTLRVAAMKTPSFGLKVLEFAVRELEEAATNTKYEAYLWTQRDLRRCDRAVLEEPSVEFVSWLLSVLFEPGSSTTMALSMAETSILLSRLRLTLRSANLPVKFLALRTIVILMRAATTNDTISEEVIRECHLDFTSFLLAAKHRLTRELVQHRKLFSLYLQAYIEVLVALWKRSPADPSSTEALSLISQPIVTTFISEDSSKSRREPGNTSALIFDRKKCRSTLLQISEDGLSVAYSGHEMWKTIVMTNGYAMGTHSWQIRIDKSSSSYLFIGIASGRANLDSFLGSDDQSWGFIGDKALYYQRNRLRVYGDAFGEGDCISVYLDCDLGTLSFSKNGVELGVAFENIVGEVFPAVAFYSRHQKVSIIPLETRTSKVAAPDQDSLASTIEEGVIVCEMMDCMVQKRPIRRELLVAAFEMTRIWQANSLRFVITRTDQPLWVDISEGKCAPLGFRAKDRVRTPRGNGTILGVADGRLWVEIDGEKGAWHCHPSKIRSLTLLVANAALKDGSTTKETSVLSSKGKSSHAFFGAQEVSGSVLSNEDRFVSFLQDKRWSLALDRLLLSAINSHCEVTSLSPWNLTPDDVLQVIESKDRDIQSQLSTMFGPTATDSIFQQNILARFGFLRYFNAYFSRVIGFFDLSWHYFAPKASMRPCRLVSLCRGSIFTSIKNEFFTVLMEKTANAPKKADDDYDYPDDLPQMQINRPKAATAKCHPGTTKSLLLSMFGQAFEALHFLPLSTLRMVYSHPMDDGQLRSFKVKFEGEGVDDYGGPYREFFSQVFAELQMIAEDESEENKPTTQTLDSHSSLGTCFLPFLMPSPNWRNGVGSNREKFVINGSILGSHTVGSARVIESALPSKRSYSSPGWAENPEVKRQLRAEMCHFFGQLLGICLRTRVCVRLDLAISVWKQLVAEDDEWDNELQGQERALLSLKEIDFVGFNLLRSVIDLCDEYSRLTDSTQHVRRRQELEEELTAMDLTFTTYLSDGRLVELCDNGSETPVTTENAKAYVRAALTARMNESREVMNVIKQGINSILPVTALGLLTSEELEKRMCGVAEVDVELLKQNTEYDEDLSSNDEFIQRFWRVLGTFEDEDKRAFLRFVWARSRLPVGTAQFHQKFKIQSLVSSSGNEGGTSASSSTGYADAQLPKSHTCFFALQLPRYSTDEICRKQLLYAVQNCVEMDGDFRLADTEMTGWNDINPNDQLRF